MSEHQQQLKGSAKEKQKHANTDPERATEERDDLEDLFRSPANPDENNGSDGGFEDALFNTPISRRIAQMLTDHNDFPLDGQELDFHHFSALESQEREGIDFANLLSAEGAALGSPAKQAAIGFDYDGAANFWPSWNLENASLDPKE
ncbi:hypothetical protein ESCO_000629 [Escovopsis weberi]|uniref:Uncharacterized protein n=1 Tax=Escovopsis weberi TaxID=150374 RepID=A0A0M8MYX9_ESCWE|nr:hypothetical protein ESCO_000629 [Escovopsis weberi]